MPYTGRATPVAVALAAIEEKAMNVREFCDDDAGYLAWLANHPDGYVINVARNRRPTDALTHHAGCRTISGQRRRPPWNVSEEAGRDSREIVGFHSRDTRTVLTRTAPIALCHRACTVRSYICQGWWLNRT